MTTTDDKEQWAPLDIGEDEIEVFTALREDVPEHLYRSVWTWIFGRFRSTSGGVSGLFNVGLARECERVLKISIPDSGPHADGSFRALQSVVDGQPPKVTWRLVDFLLSKNYYSVGSAKSFDTMLVEAGSAWTVGERAGKVGLVRRLPEGVQVAAERILQLGTAGKRLVRAWEAAFGVNPDPSKAYWFAVKAVEDASAPVVIPNDSGPTLGKVISRMEQGGQFNLPHLREDSRAATHDVLLGMMRMLWVGQYDRHGGLPQSPLPDDVTQEEAESAVILAVSLVGWFESGHVQQ
ncbi:hypothetical protein JF781_21835 [Mycobacterium sp. WUMAC-067]|uniref:hypothetical protein n=1 Tax=unclassified Mycobacterium TaxID=2642494 RepID=UPI001CD9C4AB|nr:MULTISPECIES: hypothetical protein [unclassified Mycobacterium]MCA2245000.1 hypothetical protein [Mycobacterium sp. WUMAC-067]MCA2317002.1 hypothetical protein [Mycobacterium sp. WUMAC-025]